MKNLIYIFSFLFSFSLFAQSQLSSDEVDTLSKKMKIDSNYSDPMKGVEAKDYERVSGEQLKGLNNFTLIPAESPEFYYSALEVFFDQNKLTSTCGSRMFENIEFVTAKKEGVVINYSCSNVCTGIKSLEKKNGKYPTTPYTVLNSALCDALWTGVIPVKGINK